MLKFKALNITVVCSFCFREALFLDFIMKHPIYTANYLKGGLLPDKAKTEYWIEEFFHWLFCIGPQYSNYDYFLEKEKELEHLLADLLELTGVDQYKIPALLTALHDKAVALHHKLEDDLKAS